MKNAIDRQEQLHIKIANAVALFAFIGFMVVRNYELRAESRLDRLPRHLIIGALIGLFLIVAIIVIKDSARLAFYVPGALITGIILSALFVGGAPFLFITISGIYGISSIYFSRSGFLRLLLFTNALLILVIFILRTPLAGESVSFFNHVMQWVVLHFCTLFIYLTVRHATNRHSKSLAAKESFDTMLETTPNIVALVDDLNCITYISRPLAELAHLERPDLATGRPLIDLFTDANIINMITDVLDSIGDYYDTVRVVRNDETFFYRIISKKMRGRSKGRLIDITDVTPIMKARYEAENATKAKSEFLATMSHEIRTPMNAIIGIAQIELNREALPEEYKTALDKIYTSGNGLLGIINDILDMSKIETGKLELVLTQYDIPSLINDTVQLNIMRIGSKPIEFKLEIDENLPCIIFGDELRLKQILNNLLSNAIKYTEKGYVRLSVGCEPAGEDIMLRFSVSDTGQGIKPKDQERLFSEFSRFNTEANRTTEGTGLGLSITKRLVEMMDGSISVESEYGKGSVFTAVVRQKAVDSPAIGPGLAERLCNFTFIDRHRAEKLKTASTPMPYGKVLVVDDVATNLFVAEGLLSLFKLNVETADSGFAAIDRIKTGSVYDVIFMDHMMPQMDGVETTRNLRELGYEGVIVALTANALVGNEEMFAKNGFDGFISKPIDIRQLNDVLDRFIRSRYPEEAKKYESEEPAGKVPEINPKLLEVFCGDAEKAVVTLTETAATGDVKLFAITAHAMKSALANIGEHEASSLAASLENAGLGGDTEFIAANVRELVGALDSLIRKFRPSDTGAVEVQELQEDTDYLRQQLQVIKTACEDYDDAAAYAALDRLKERQWRPETAGALGKMRDALFLHSEFDETAKMAGELLASF